MSPFTDDCLDDAEPVPPPPRSAWSWRAAELWTCPRCAGVWLVRELRCPRCGARADD